MDDGGHRAVNVKPRTREQVRQAGLEALRRELGPVDMIRFLHRFDSASGDSSTERHEWIDDWTLEEIMTALEARRADGQSSG